MLLTFFDFITQGLLKKNKWVAKIYFPVYWVFSFLTLSILYRPLIYNFLDNKFGKRLILSLTPFYILILVITSLEYRNSNYLDHDSNSSAEIANKENYFDMLTEEEDYPGDAVIPSKVITTPYLQVFIPYAEKIEDRIFAYNDSIKPKEDLRGLSSTITFSSKGNNWGMSTRQKDSIRSIYLKTFNESYSFQIDTLQLDSDFVITTSPKGQLGFETYLNIENLSEGKHLLRVKRKRKEKGEIVSVTEASIPFWYFNN